MTVTRPARVGLRMIALGYLALLLLLPVGLVFEKTFSQGLSAVWASLTTPAAVMTNVPALARRGVNVVLGTTGWQQHEAALRTAIAEARSGIVQNAF